MATFDQIQLKTRTNQQWCFIKKGVIKTFAKFTGKHLCQSLFFDKVARLKPENLLKRDSDKGVFQFLRAAIF